MTQVLGAVYQGSPVVMEAYAVPNCELMQFDDQPALERFVSAELAAGRPTANPHQSDGKRVVVSGFLKRVQTWAGELLA